VNDELIPRPTADREIASTQDGIDITRGYTGPLLVPADRILRQRGGNDLSIYEQVLSEPQVHSTFQQRRQAVTKCEWQVDAASDRRVDRKAAEFVREQLQRVGWDRITDRMLYGVWYGYAVAEVLYGVEDGLIVWNAIKVRNRRRFRFTPDGELRMLTYANFLEGVELPPAKFWSFCVGADNDDEPYGLGLGHWCYWPVLFKRNGIKFWLTFIEKFAAPTGIGEYEANASAEERRRLLAAVQAIQTDSGIIIPKGMEVRLLEAARSGSVDYRALHDTMDETIAKVTLGQTMTSQDGGSLSQAKVHLQVRQDLVKADADMVCESFNLGPIRWLCRWNFPDAELPRVFRILDEPEDLTARAERDKTVSEIGFRPSLAYIHATYGGEWEAAPRPTAAPPVLDDDGGLAFAAAPSSPDFADQLVGLLAERAGKPTAAWLDRIYAAVESADSFDELDKRLTALLPDLSSDELAATLQSALVAARLSGRDDAGG
jgi:phage gp29-like protein